MCYKTSKIQSEVVYYINFKVKQISEVLMSNYSILDILGQKNKSLSHL